MQEKRETNVKATDALAGELWQNKKERIRKTSKYGSLPDWDLCSVSLLPESLVVTPIFAAKEFSE